MSGVRERTSARRPQRASREARPKPTKQTGLLEAGEHPPRARVSERFVELWFAGTLFTSAALLFCVQPLVAKMVLPLWGGAPAVWNTCQLFFQAILLVGYAYAHFSVRALGGVRRQMGPHLALLLAPMIVLPIAVVGAGSQATSGVGLTVGLLALLATSVGLPFFVLSTTSPLLQRWYATTGKDPYFLYAASNLGSMLSLAAYPLILEPYVGLRQISRFWTYGYGVLMVMIAGCAILVWKQKNTAPNIERTEPAEPSAEASGNAAPITMLRRLKWVGLAFLPSSLMLGVTNYLTTDIAPVPLLWVLPLALYLGTFIIVFGNKRILSHALMVRLLPLAVTASALLVIGRMTQPLSLVVTVHLATFFVATMVCHGELAKDRPDPKHLTEFFLLLSVGGVLGGINNAIVAPAVFNRVLEYPLALVATLFARRIPTEAAEAPSADDVDAKSAPRPGRSWADYALPAIAFAVTAALLSFAVPLGKRFEWLSLTGLMWIPVAIIFPSRTKSVRYACAMTGILLASFVVEVGSDKTLYQDRSFFGVLKVTADDTSHYFIHGVTLHGRQDTAEDRRREPLTYYFKNGPIGEIMQWKADKTPNASIGVVGLGVGSLASYARPGQDWTFYEIDPAVVAMAKDPKYFTYLSDAFGPEGPPVRVGDARIRLNEETNAHYDLLVLDAFSSDAIPTHLLTKQALDLYASRLAPHGIVAIHISNKYLDLSPIMANLAKAEGLAILGRNDTTIREEDKEHGKSASKWIVMTRERADLDELTQGGREWKPVEERPELGVWSDDFSNILRIMTWSH